MKDEVKQQATGFLAQPWTKAILEEADTEWRVISSRKTKQSNEDALFGGTLNSPSTISHGLVVYKKPSADTIQIDECHTLLQLGSALDGWPQILHGGIVATIIDEAMGVLITINNIFHHNNPGRNDGPNKNMAVLGGGSLTGQLNITYKNPVRTPGAVVITTRYVKREGRKDWIRAEVRQQVDGTSSDAAKEVICSIGESLFIARKAKI